MWDNPENMIFSNLHNLRTNLVKKSILYIDVDWGVFHHIVSLSCLFLGRHFFENVEDLLLLAQITREQQQQQQASWMILIRFDHTDNKHIDCVFNKIKKIQMPTNISNVINSISNQNARRATPMYSFFLIANNTKSLLLFKIQKRICNL